MMNRIGRNDAADDPYLRDGWSVESSGEWPTLMSPERTTVFRVGRPGYGYRGYPRNVFKNLRNEDSNSGIYELRIRSINGETRVAYVGSGTNIETRLKSYTGSRSHQRHNIEPRLKKGDSIEYRYRITDNYIEEEKYLLKKYKYDFNVMDQGTGASWHPARYMKRYTDTIEDYLDKKRSIVDEMFRDQRSEMENRFGQASDENPEGCELMTERFDGMRDPFENCRLMEQLHKDTMQHFDDLGEKLKDFKTRLQKNPFVRGKRPRAIDDAGESGVGLEEGQDLPEMGGIVDDVLGEDDLLGVLELLAL